MQAEAGGRDSDLVMASQQRVQGWQGVSTYLRVGHESVDNVVDTAFEGVKVVQTDTNLGI